MDPVTKLDQGTRRASPCPSGHLSSLTFSRGAPKSSAKADTAGQRPVQGSCHHCGLNGHVGVGVKCWRSSRGHLLSVGCHPAKHPCLGNRMVPCKVMAAGALLVASSPPPGPLASAQPCAQDAAAYGRLQQRPPRATPQGHLHATLSPQLSLPHTPLPPATPATLATPATPALERAHSPSLPLRNSLVTL